MNNLKEMVFALYDFQFDKEVNEVPYSNGVYVEYDGEKAQVGGGTTPQLMRAYTLLVKNISDGKTNFCIHEKPHFDTCAAGLDLSRNAVMRVDKVKDFLRRIAALGMNTLSIYMEDTYELPGYPHFGYMRGRYSIEELKEMDDYAFSLGVQLIPTIQTLGHMERYLIWSEASKIKDTSSVMLADDENTYEFIEKQIQTMRTAFRTKLIGIGCDETHDLGLGRHLDIHGYQSRHEIYMRHITRVLEICKKYDFKAICSGDMFFRMFSKWNWYYDPDVVFPENLKDEMPDVILSYWDYYHRDAGEYRRLFEMHKKLGREVVFGGGIWTFEIGPLVNGVFTLDTMYPGLKEAIKANMKFVGGKMFGDDGTECDYYQGLPFLAVFSEICYQGEACTREHIIDMVEFLSGTSWEVYEAQDKFVDHRDEGCPISAVKNLLYTNLFYGLVYADDSFEELHDIFAKGYEVISNAKNYKYKEFASLIAKIALTKIEILNTIRSCYKDKEYSRNLINKVLPELKKDYERLSLVHRQQWMETYKPFGYEIINGRYAWAIADIDFQSYRLQQYVDGVIENIDELDCRIEKGKRDGYNWFKASVSTTWHF